MQVKLTTVVETIIDVDPENTEEFDTAKAEIFVNSFISKHDEDSLEDIKAEHSEAVVFDHVRCQTVTHSFTKVE
jgi:hypothetical protein